MTLIFLIRFNRAKKTEQKINKKIYQRDLNKNKFSGLVNELINNKS